MIYIFDIDGTLADLTHRLHFIQNKPKDWDSFFKAAVNDAPIFEVIRLAQILNGAGQQIYYFSGRSEEIRQDTLLWLTKHNLPQALNSHLYMRKAKDHREDNIVKAELLEEFLKEPREPIGGVFDDRQQVVDMWRSKGYKVFQVAKGDF